MITNGLKPQTSSKDEIILKMRLPWLMLKTPFNNSLEVTRKRWSVSTISKRVVGFKTLFGNGVD